MDPILESLPQARPLLSRVKLDKDEGAVEFPVLSSSSEVKNQDHPRPTYPEPATALNDITCTICQSTYTDPHILSCLHSFCKSCLSKHISTTKVRGSYGWDKIKCPLCRSEHIIILSNDNLIPNTQLARKIENLSENFEPIRQCDECEAANVINFCSECEIFLCELCVQYHKRVARLKSHELVHPEQAKKKPKPKSFQCATHPSESLEVYCTTCNNIICRDCALYAHRGHLFKRAVEASDEIRKSLVSDSEELVAKLRTFRSHAEAVAKVEKHVTTYPDKLKAFITAHFEELHKMLEKRKEALLKEVDTQYNGFSKTLWVEKDIVETSICKLEAGIKFAQQVANIEDKLEVAVLGNKAITSMNQMTKTLYWNPKAIKNLGPVGYAAQESDEYQKFMEKIGILKNMVISISDKGYRGYYGFISYGTYCVEVEVNFGNNVKALFPQMSISCKTEEGSVLCTTKQQQGKWEVTFQTANPGTYTIMATLEIAGKHYGEIVETIRLYDGKATEAAQTSNSTKLTSMDRPVLKKLSESPYGNRVWELSSERESSAWVCSGNESSGRESSGRVCSGNESSGRESSGRVCSGNESSGRESSGQVCGGGRAESIVRESSGMRSGKGKDSSGKGKKSRY